jgi:PAS domain S-box-containing protein
MTFEEGDIVDSPPEDLLDSPEQEAKRLFEISLDLLCVASPEGYFLQVNPAFERVLGYSEEELTSKPMVEFIHPEDRDRTHEVLQKSKTDDVAAFTNRYICKDGSTVWLEWKSRSHHSGDLIYASARDITELKHTRLERDRLQTKFQQAQKLESVAILAGGIAHDFNNLLTTVLGNAGLMLMDLEQSNPLRDRIEAIQRAASTAADMCEQLLAYAGKGQFDVEAADLSDIVRETDHLIDATVSASTTVEYDLTEGLPAAELDATQVRQILMNAIQNASEALEDTDRPRIGIATGARDCTSSDFADMYLGEERPDGWYVYLEISDNGCGMTPDEVQRIFDPFFTTKFTGRGLGLAATLGIIRAHDGAVQVDTAPGDGTTFRFYFPARDTLQPFSRENDAVSVPKFDAETILVVDDEKEIRKLVERVLVSQDIGVLKAVDGDDALEAFAHHHEEISAVLLDVRMPGTNTKEVLRHIKDIAPDTPVILSSGYSEESSTEGLTETTCEAFLQKPYGPPQLLRTLSEILEADKE